MASEFDKLLEDVAQGLTTAYSARNVHGKPDDEIFVINAERALKRRLLGLLEAGELMREWTYSVTSYEDNVPYVNGKYDANVERVQDAWDKQKQAALEGR